MMIGSSPRLRRMTISLVAVGLMLLALIQGLHSAAARAAAPAPIDLRARSFAPATSGNRLVNPDFEDGWYLPYPEHNSIRVPIGWSIRWYTDAAPGGFFLQPETTVLDPVWPNCCADNYPPRIFSGEHAFEVGKQWGLMDVTLYQSVGGVPIGAVVTASAWLHSWVSACNPNPKDKPPEMALSLLGPNTDDEFNCAPGFWPVDSNRMIVGLDPQGGVNPRSPNVVWNWDQDNPAWWGPYDYYSNTVPAVAVAQAHTVTMFLRGVTLSSARFNAMYFDAASLTYAFPIELRADQDYPWPLSSTVTVTVVAPVSLTQVTAGVIDPVGSSVPIEFGGSTGATPEVQSQWLFHPLSPGRHRFELNAAELTAPVAADIDVAALDSRFTQDHLLPRDGLTPTEPVLITFTLSSPITLTEAAAALSDPLDQPLTITLVATEALPTGLNYHWLFTPVNSGLHTVSISSTTFITTYTRATVAATDRVYLPVSLRTAATP